MFSRTVVATDLRPSSEGIIGCAGALATLGVREAWLVFAIDPESGPSHDEDAAFRHQVASLEACGIRVHGETPLGYPAHEIVALAAEHAVGLIVMGTRGLGLYHTPLSGSVSSDVVRMSPVPVLLAPTIPLADAQTGGATCARLLASVLAPVDLTSAAERVCDLACSLAPKGIGRLELLTAVEVSPDAAREGREGRARDLLSALAAHARAATACDVVSTIVRGNADEVVAQFAASGRYTLVVLAPGCHDTIESAFDSVTSAVMRSSSTPVVLAPPGCDTGLYPRGNT